MGTPPPRRTLRWMRGCRKLAFVTTLAAWAPQGGGAPIALSAPSEEVANSISAIRPIPTISGVRSVPYPRLANVFLLGAVDDVDFASLARWDLLVLNSVWTESQLARLRALNPDIQLLMYVCPYSLPRTPYPFNQLESDLHRYASSNDLWWYSTRGLPGSDWPNTAMVNVTSSAPAGPEGAWRDWLAARLARHLEETPQWDGLFLDNFWREISWAQPWLQLDSDCNPSHQPAGCDGVADSPAHLDAAWNATMRRFARRLRSDLDRIGRARSKSYALLSNGASDYFEALNGTMIENFPRGVPEPGNSHGYGWSRWMLQSRVGYLTPLYTGRPYSAGIVNAGWPGTSAAPARSDEFERHKRFTFASALLGDGFYSLDRAPTTHAALWWEPEYAPGEESSGYLGMPRGSGKRVRATTGANLIANGGFEAPFESPWSFQAASGLAGVRLDAQQFSGGAPSVRIDITRADATFAVKLAFHPVRVEAGRSYTLRFSARATTSQEVRIHLYSEDCPNARCLGETRLWIGKSWKRYEYSFTSTGSADAGLDFFFGSPGTVWIDDVSLHPGDTSVFRRDFDRGIALVNATADTVTVDLGTTFQHLQVAGSPLYDGARVRFETLAPWDGRILLRASSSRKADPAAPITTAFMLTGNLPMRESVGILFGIETLTEARLNVHDVAGRRVRTLIAGPLAAGTHTFTWDRRDALGRRVASGVYFVTLAAGSRQRALKLVAVD